LHRAEDQAPPAPRQRGHVGPPTRHQATNLSAESASRPTDRSQGPPRTTSSARHVASLVCRDAHRRIAGHMWNKWISGVMTKNPAEVLVRFGDIAMADLILPNAYFSDGSWPVGLRPIGPPHALSSKLSRSASHLGCRQAHDVALAGVGQGVGLAGLRDAAAFSSREVAEVSSAFRMLGPLCWLWAPCDSRGCRGSTRSTQHGSRRSTARQFKGFGHG
jgi:hypothetical protein